LIPNFLLRILRIGYLYGITSDRKLVEELRMHLAWRWFNAKTAPKKLIMMAPQAPIVRVTPNYVNTPESH